MPLLGPWIQHQSKNALLKMRYHQHGLPGIAIALLSAFIVPWIAPGPALGQSEAESEPDSSRPIPKLLSQDAEFSYETTLRYISVDGDEDQFRANTWMEEGFGGRIDRFRYQKSIGDDREFELQGSLGLPENNYEIDWRYEKFRYGYLEGGFEQYRKYFDETGGFYAPYSQSAFDLDRELSLDRGKAWLEAGLTKPTIPEMSLRYEYHYKDGTKSTLQWGTVSGPGQPRNIYPASKSVDQDRHVIEYRIGDGSADFSWQETARLEIDDLDTTRRNASVVRPGRSKPDKAVRIQEGHKHIQGSNTLKAEKKVNDWLRVSGGYLYKHLDGEASYDATTFLTPNAGVPPTTALTGNDPFWFDNEIILDRESHVVNGNTMIEPSEGLTVSSGIQSDWTRQSGFGDVRLDEPDPSGVVVRQPATLDANLDKLRVQEDVEIRFTRIPYTTLFFDTRLEQEQIDQRERQVSNGSQAFLRSTDHESDLKQYKTGFSLSPWTWTSLHASYKRRLKQNDYDHTRDEALVGVPGQGFSAFIRGRDIDTDEIEVKTVFRPIGWLKTSLRYQLIATDFVADTDPIAGGQLSPGGRIFSGNYDVNRYSANLTLTPWQRIYFTSSVSYRRSRTVTTDHGNQAVAPYVGDIYSLHQSANWIVDEKTDMNLGYTLSLTDYEQDNVAAGLPLGMAFAQHTIQMGFKHRLRPNVTTKLQYAFYLYNETSTGGRNDFKAHGLFASLGMTF